MRWSFTTKFPWSLFHYASAISWAMFRDRERMMWVSTGQMKQEWLCSSLLPPQRETFISRLATSATFHPPTHPEVQYVGMLELSCDTDLPACVTVVRSWDQGCLASCLEGFWDSDGWRLLTAGVEISQLFAVIFSLERHIRGHTYVLIFYVFYLCAFYVYFSWPGSELVPAEQSWE